MCLVLRAPMRVSSLRRTTWDIMASVFLQRPPVIAPPMSAVEQRYKETLAEIETENSLLNNYELKSKKDAILLAKKEELEAAGKDLSELEGELEVTNLMREQEWNTKAEILRKTYGLDPIRRGENESEKSLERLLDRQLVLTVRQRFGQKEYQSPWKLPEIEHKAGETLRQTAERCLGEIVSGDLSVAIQGNAPCSVFTHKYAKPIAAKRNKVGAKIFFYNAVLDPKSRFEVNKNEISDFCWLSVDEFKDKVAVKGYKKSVNPLFIE